MKSIVTRLLLACICLAPAFAQDKLTFEVASIKPSEPQPMNMMRIGMQVDGSMVRYTGTSLRDVIRVAYRMKDFQIEGPDWIGGARFDISAKLPDGAKQDQVPEMLQALLSERFKLTAHRESKEHAIYALIPGKEGAKLKLSEFQTPDPAVPGGTPGGGSAPAGGPSADKDASRGKPLSSIPGAGPGGGRGMRLMMDPSGMHLKATGVSLPNLADAVSRFTERPVVDMTSIKGDYDFDLVFTPERMPGGAMTKMAAISPGPTGDSGPSDPGPSIMDAVQTYGLKLEPRKAPMDVLVIDHIEKTPTEN